MTRTRASTEIFPTTKYLLIAGALFAFELILGIGLIGIVGGFVAATISCLTDRGLQQKLCAAGMFICVVLVTFCWLNINERTARTRAIPVIEGCKEFRAKHSRYPSNLTELIPVPLPSIPTARYTLAARKFFYESDRPALCYTAMFHGVFCYDFRSDQWIAND
jgi:hypothetical protein